MIDNERIERGRASLKRGKRTEFDTLRELELLGICNPKEIATPFKVTRVLKSGMMQGFFEKKVTGDIRAEFPNGISVLAEVKATSPDNEKEVKLPFGRLEPHQRESLSAHRGLSLLIWVRERLWGTDYYIMRWEDVLDNGFQKGKPLSSGQADALDRETRVYIKALVAGGICLPKKN